MKSIFSKMLITAVIAAGFAVTAEASSSLHSVSDTTKKMKMKKMDKMKMHKMKKMSKDTAMKM